MRYSTLSRHPELALAEGLPEVRGWEVRPAADDEMVGRVQDLVVDEQNQIRYLDLDSGGVLSGKRLLLPLSAAQADERDDLVWVFGMTKQQFSAPNKTAARAGERAGWLPDLGSSRRTASGATAFPEGGERFRRVPRPARR